MSEPQQELPKTMLILKSNPASLATVETFLRNRGWRIYSTANLKEALVQVVQNKPSYVLLSVDHPSPKARALPKILMQAMQVAIIAFAEKQNSASYKLLNDALTEYRVFPPVTGPAIERCVNKYLKDLNTKQTINSANNDFKADNLGNRGNDRISIKGGGNGNIEVKGGESSSQFGSDATSRLLSQFLGEDAGGANADGSANNDPNLIFAQSADDDISSSQSSGMAYNPGSLQATDPTHNGFNNTYVQKGSAGNLGSVVPPGSRNDSLGGPQGAGNDDLGSVHRMGIGPDGKPYAGSQVGPDGKPFGEPQLGSDGKPLPSAASSGQTGADGNPFAGAPTQSNPFGNADTASGKNKDSKNDDLSAPAKEDGPVPMGSREYRRNQQGAAWEPAATEGKDLFIKEKNGPPSKSESVFIRGAQKSLEDSVETRDGVVKEKIEETTNMACIVVESARFSGYLVAVMGKNQKIDSKFIDIVKQRLFKFLKENGEDMTDRDTMGLNIKQVDFEPWALEYADFLKKSVHNGSEIAMAFFPRQNINTVLEDSVHHEMSKININDLKADSAVEFDLYVYLPANNKYVLYTPKGGIFYGRQLDRLKQQGVTHMHVQKDAAKDISKYQAQNYLNGLIDEQEQKKKILAS